MTKSLDFERLAETRGQVMEPFHLETVMKAGGHCVTRSGQSVRIICTDCQCVYAGFTFPIVALVKEEELEFAEAYTYDGHFYADGRRCDLDLFCLPKEEEALHINVQVKDKP